MAAELRSGLPPEALVTPYTPPLRGGLFVEYTKRLADIPRWNGKDGPSRMPENTLQHTLGILKIVDEEMYKYPALTNTLDLDAVRDMVWLHDGPEIVVGDHFMGGENFTTYRSRQKRRERAGARYLARRIPDSDERERAVAIFQRYDDCDPTESTDREALFAHLIDKFQGTRFGLEHGGIPSLVPDLSYDEVDKRRQNAHLSLMTIERFAKPLTNLLNGEALGELQRFTAIEVELFGERGFAAEAEQTMSELELRQPRPYRS